MDATTQYFVKLVQNQVHSAVDGVVDRLDNINLGTTVSRSCCSFIFIRMMGDNGFDDGSYAYLSGSDARRSNALIIAPTKKASNVDVKEMTLNGILISGAGANSSTDREYK
jgi:hypothetical protein